MKNLLVFITPVKDFDKERHLLAKVQIDNSLELGWKPKDILIVTNYPYEYNGVKAIEVDDSNYYADRPRSIKTSVIPYLIDHEIITSGDVYWNHDFDCYQMEPMHDEEFDFIDIGLTDYGWKPRWCLGSYFFRSTAKDIFESVRDLIFQNKEDERAMLNTLRKFPKFNERVKRLNITYNFGMRNVGYNYSIAWNPIKAVHFHPWYPLVPTLDIFMYGKNELGFPIMTKRLIKLFQHHGIK